MAARTSRNPAVQTRMLATDAIAAIPKPRRRLAATGKVALLLLVVAGGFWGWKFWRAWQVEELLEASPHFKAPAVTYPAWLHTSLTDPVVRFLYRSPTTLGFYQNSFEDSWFRRLSAVPDLAEFNIEDSKFGDAGAQYLEPLKKLERLNFTDCPNITDGALPHLSRLVRLKSLWLYGTGITDAGMKNLLSLPNLEGLSLQRTAITDAGVATVARLPNLHSLLLGTPRIANGQSQITERGLAELAHLPQLESLALWDVELNGAGVEALKSLPQLSRLDFGGPHTTSAEVDRLRELTRLSDLTLNLQDAVVGDEITTSLLATTSLHTLYLDRTRITDAGLARLAAHGALSFLSLRQTAITADGLAAFKGNRRLGHVFLSDTAIGDDVFELLLTLPLLQHVHLAGTRITDAGIERLATHPNLKGLFLSRTAVTAKGVDAFLRSRPVVYYLVLDETSIGDDDLEILIASKAVLTSLGNFSLRKTKVTAAGVAELRRKMPGVRIDWEPKP